MVTVGRRFFFNQTFQKKQRRITIITIVCVITAIIVTFSITSKFHDNSGEKGQIKYKVKETYDVEIFNSTVSNSYYKNGFIHSNDSNHGDGTYYMFE